MYGILAPMVYFFNYLDLQNAHGRESGEENAVIAALACAIETKELVSQKKSKIEPHQTYQKTA